MQTITNSEMIDMEYRYLEQFVSQLQSQCRYTFTQNELQDKFAKDKNALQMALNRFKRKGRIVRVRNGFYVIVPPEYAAQGILPAPLFVHELMQFLQKSYYVGLYSAAELHGSAHQKPQSFILVTEKPTIRRIQVKRVIINFVLKKKMPAEGIIKIKTDTGYINVSNPILTAVDLVQFERQSGGFYRMLEILEELSESFREQDVQTILKNDIPASVLQRFGYLCERHLNCIDIDRIVSDHLAKGKMYPVPLSPAESSRAGSINKNWQVIENVDLEKVL